jgi:hypothetical protein
MNIGITSYMQLVSYCHLYYQQYAIDNQIDYAELQNRLGWIDFANNYANYQNDINNDEHCAIIVQRILDLINNPPQP